MNIIIPVLKIFLVIGYIVTIFFYWKQFYKENEKGYPLKRVLIPTLLIHTLLLIIVGFATNRLPLQTPTEGLLVCTLFIALAHLGSEFFSRTKQLGIFTLLPVSIIAIPAAVLTNVTVPSGPSINFYLSIHIISSISAFAGFGISCIIALMYVMLHRKLKDKDFDIYFRKLPPLQKLEQLCTIWVWLGLMFMLFSTLSGSVWASSQESSGIIDFLPLYILMIMYLAVVVIHKFFSLRGLMYIIGVIICFAVLLISQVSRFHGF